MNGSVAKVVGLVGSMIFCAVSWQGGVLATAKTAAANSAAQTQSSRRANESYNDERAIRTAAETSMTQVDFGKLAEQKAQNPEVKKFAQLLVEEHSKITEQLKELGMSGHINLPTSINSRDAETHRELEREPSGFDHHYAAAVASQLAREVGEFERGASMSSKPALKDFFDRTKPTLQAELQQAKRLTEHVH
jgi:putative membrane protein